MNYKALKWVIDWLIKSHKCTNCWSFINEEWIDIVWAAWTTVNIDITCPSCDKHSIIKAEIAQVNVSNLNINNIKNWNIKDEIIKQLKWNKSIKTISDSDISKLNEKLKKDDIKINDLFDD